MILSHNMYISQWLDRDKNQFAEAINQFCHAKIAPISNKATLSEQSLRQLWLSMGEMGLHGITLAENDFGLNLGYTEHALAILIVSQYSAGIGLSYAAHSQLCISHLSQIANPEQKKQWLPKLISGEHIGALAISEPSTGSDARSLSLQAKRVSGGYLLTGEKMWITNAPIADVIIVYAKTEPSRSGISTFIVNPPLDGLTRSQPIEKMGMTLSPTGELSFNNCFVPESQLIGTENSGDSHMLSGLNYERLLLAAGPLGIHQACLNLAIDYSQTRTQFGKSISEHQLIQSKIADLYTAYNAGACYLIQACKAAEQSTLSRHLAASSILFTSENATKAALETIQILGGNGYSNAYPAQRYLRDAKLYEIGAGTNEIRRILISKSLTRI